MNFSCDSEDDHSFSFRYRVGLVKIPPGILIKKQEVKEYSVDNALPKTIYTISAYLSFSVFSFDHSSFAAYKANDNEETLLREYEYCYVKNNLYKVIS